jgi:hypothetical protein
MMHFRLIIIIGIICLLLELIIFLFIIGIAYQYIIMIVNLQYYVITIK